jgi:predicted small lipoprotein YifL
MNKLSVFALVLATMAGLCACGDTHLLSSRGAPDELSVVEGPSLELPPDFELRPPSEGATNVSVPLKDESIDARKILNQPAARAASDTPKTDTADAWLVKAAGGDKADPDIREKLTDKPALEEEKKSEKGFFSRLNPFSGDDADAE